MLLLWPSGGLMVELKCRLAVGFLMARRDYCVVQNLWTWSVVAIWPGLSVDVECDCDATSRKTKDVLREVTKEIGLIERTSPRALMGN